MVTPNSPKGWSIGIVYLRAPHYSKKLAADTLKTLIVPKHSLPTSEALIKSTTPSSLVRIVKITTESHPARGQHGLFANQHLPPNTFILSYLGFVHDHSDTDLHSDYDLSLDRERGVGVDASKMGNEARFINDYRGVAPGPNAEFRDVWVDLGNAKAEKRMAVFVLSAGKSGKRSKGIPKGDEILISYGKGFWSEREATAE